MAAVVSVARHAEGAVALAAALPLLEGRRAEARSERVLRLLVAPVVGDLGLVVWMVVAVRDGGGVGRTDSWTHIHVCMYTYIHDIIIDDALGRPLPELRHAQQLPRVLDTQHVRELHQAHVPHLCLVIFCLELDGVG